MFFLKRIKLENQLMTEIKELAGVDSFPYSEAQEISRILGMYDKGSEFLFIFLKSSMKALEKYPNLYANWDNLLLKYKKLGLFSKWDVDADFGLFIETEGL